MSMNHPSGERIAERSAAALWVIAIALTALAVIAGYTTFGPEDDEPVSTRVEPVSAVDPNLVLIAEAIRSHCQVQVSIARQAEWITSPDATERLRNEC